VMIPHTVQKEVQVQVCRMVPETRMVPACGCSCGGAASSCGREKCRPQRCRRRCC
jgi:hypothetical protein